MITIEHKGNFEKTTAFLNKMKKRNVKSILDKYGKRGVELLAASTPTDTGKTAESWDYDIIVQRDRYEITWTNSNVNNGVNIAMILQYGHGTRQGGYVQGRDYINPVTQQVFDEMANELWGEVTSS